MKSVFHFCDLAFFEKAFSLTYIGSSAQTRILFKLSQNCHPSVFLTAVNYSQTCVENHCKPVFFMHFSKKLEINLFDIIFYYLFSFNYFSLIYHFSFFLMNVPLLSLKKVTFSTAHLAAFLVLSSGQLYEHYSLTGKFPDSLCLLSRQKF
jgi:hypothetical protein